METSPNQKALTTDLFADYQATESARANVPQAQPVVSGQCAQVLELIRLHGPILSFVMTADYAIPEAAARVHDLRAKGFNILTQIQPEITFRGRVRRNAARYSIGCPEWIAPPPRQAGSVDLHLAGLLAFGTVCLVLLAGGAI